MTNSSNTTKTTHPRPSCVGNPPHEQHQGKDVAVLPVWGGPPTMCTTDRCLAVNRTKSHISCDAGSRSLSPSGAAQRADAVRRYEAGLGRKGQLPPFRQCECPCRPASPAGWSTGRSASRRRPRRRCRRRRPRRCRHRVGRGDDLVLGVVQPAELRVDLYRQVLGRHALGMLELGGRRLRRGAGGHLATVDLPNELVLDGLVPTDLGGQVRRDPVGGQEG